MSFKQQNWLLPPCSCWFGSIYTIHNHCNLLGLLVFVGIVLFLFYVKSVGKNGISCMISHLIFKSRVQCWGKKEIYFLINACVVLVDVSPASFQMIHLWPHIFVSVQLFVWIETFINLGIWHKCKYLYSQQITDTLNAFV